MTIRTELAVGKKRGETWSFKIVKEVIGPNGVTLYQEALATPGEGMKTFRTATNGEGTVIEMFEKMGQIYPPNKQ